MAEFTELPAACIDKSSFRLFVDICTVGVCQCLMLNFVPVDLLELLLTNDRTPLPFY